MRFFSFLLSVVSIILSVHYFLTLDAESILYNRDKLFYLHLSAVVISILLLLILTNGKKEKLYEIKTNNGVIKIQKEVFMRLVENLLEKKEEVGDYTVGVVQKDDKIIYDVHIIPNFEKEFSFVEFSELVIDEIKQTVSNSTSLDVVEVEMKITEKK